jgi:predicted transcriptional regulator
MARRLRKTLPKERLSPSEWEIMRICWRLGRCTVRDVLREDLRTRKRDYRTILTFMTRMSNKGWLTVSREGNKNRYTPALEEERALRKEIRRFLEEVVGAEPQHLEILKSEVRAKSRKLGRRRTTVQTR